MTPFYVLTTQRSGSTVLIRTLDEHPSIFCAGELFFPGEGIHHQEWQYPFFGKRLIKNRQFLNLINYPFFPYRVNSHLHNFYKNATDKNDGAVGFKLMFGQYKLAPNSFKLALSQKKCILLVRENLLDMAVSKIKAKTSKVYHLAGESDIQPNEKIFIAPVVLEKSLIKLAKKNKKINQFQAENILKIDYDELFDWKKLSYKIAVFLEVEMVELSPVLKKLTTKPLIETIENYNELKSFFSATEFSIFFK